VSSTAPDRSALVAQRSVYQSRKFDREFTRTLNAKTVEVPQVTRSPFRDSFRATDQSSRIAAPGAHLLLATSTPLTNGRRVSFTSTPPR